MLRRRPARPGKGVRGSPRGLAAPPAPRPGRAPDGDLTPVTDLRPVSELEMKDSLAIETTPRLMSFHHQSMTDPTLQDTIFGARKSTLLRDWVGKLPDTAYERRLKSLMEKGTEPKVEMVRTLKPEEVLSCR